MGLLQHQTPRVTVPLLDGNSVSLRGLGLDDIGALLAENLEDMSKIAELYTDQKVSIFSQKPFHDFLISLANKFPHLTMEVISRAADEPEAYEVKLGIGIQIACLTAVLKMTVEDAGGLGNLFAQIRTFAGSVAAAAEADAGGNRQQRRSAASTGRGGNRSTSSSATASTMPPIGRSAASGGKSK